MVNTYHVGIGWRELGDVVGDHLGLPDERKLDEVVVQRAELGRDGLVEGEKVLRCAREPRQEKKLAGVINLRHRH